MFNFINKFDKSRVGAGIDNSGSGGGGNENPG